MMNSKTPSPLKELDLRSNANSMNSMFSQHKNVSCNSYLGANFSKDKENKVGGDELFIEDLFRQSRQGKKDKNKKNSFGNNLVENLISKIVKT